MIEDIDTGFGNSRDADVSGCVSYFLKELGRGPFAPALSGEILSAFRIPGKLADFLRDHLAEQVIMLARAEFSPVHRPALALRSRLKDLAYWQTYRLSSLFKVWEAPAIDMSVLDQPQTAAFTPYAPQHHQAQTRFVLSEDDFVSTFEAGRIIPGKALKRAYASDGLIVEIDVQGRKFTCFCPIASLPVSEQGSPDRLIGVKAEWRVGAILISKRSVMLSFVRRLEGENGDHTSVPEAPGSEDADEKFHKIQTRLALLERLMKVGAISESEYSTRRAAIISEI